MPPLIFRKRLTRNAFASAVFLAMRHLARVTPALLRLVITPHTASRRLLPLNCPSPTAFALAARRFSAVPSTPWVAPGATPAGDALKKYGRDLTQAAREGKLDPVIGRDDVIRRTIQVLSRRTKNNPVLIGEPGVGKTAIAEVRARTLSLRTSIF